MGPASETRMELLRKVLLVFGIVGALVFGAGFATSLANPQFVESIGRHLIRKQVEVRVKETLDRLDNSALVAVARRMAGVEAAKARQASERAAKLSDHVQKVVAEMGDPACPCRKLMLLLVDPRTQQESAAAHHAGSVAKLEDFIRTKYVETAHQLQREFRIFTATNAVVFALLVIAIYVRPRANLHLLPSAILLLVSAAATAYFYLFNQDWLRTIVFSDYVGLGYVAWLGAAFVLLCDIIFNKAMLTIAALGAVTAPLAAC